MDNKAIQEQRMKNYLLSAAKDIIRAEGVSAVSARNIAERAGYSYATLYNYFDDVRDLIFSCIEDFMDECRDYVASETVNIPPGKERITEISKSYARFFVQYPGIFELIYLQKPVDISGKNSKLEKIDGFFDTLTGAGSDTIDSSGNDGRAAGDIVRRNYKYALHGLLMFFLNRRSTMGYPQLMDEISKLA
jgi:AcrR family transcriptional regulator